MNKSMLNNKTFFLYELLFFFNIRLSDASKDVTKQNLVVIVLKFPFANSF